MGSSAAYACALSAVVNIVAKASINQNEDGELSDTTPFADFMEKLYHVNPSGCDVQIVSRGGFLQFKKKDGSYELNKYPTSKNLFNFMLVNTNKERLGKI